MSEECALIRTDIDSYHNINPSKNKRNKLRTHCDAKSICACLDAAYAEAVSGRFVVDFFFGLALVVPADDLVTVLDLDIVVAPDPPPPPALELPVEGAAAVPIFVEEVVCLLIKKEEVRKIPRNPKKE
jgi:hypothetical protein